MGKKKKRSLAQRYRIFVDYENSPDCLEMIKTLDYEEVWIFVGRQQKKIPLELVQQLQQLGSAVHWVSPGAVGKNALDFILALHVGMHHAVAPKELAFSIVSGDRGFDPLIGELAKEDRIVVRLDPERGGKSRKGKKKTTRAKVARKTPAKKKTGRTRTTLSLLTDLVEDRLNRMSEERLPSKKKNLLKHVESQLPAPDKEKAESVVEALKRRKAISIALRSGQVKYLSRHG